MLLRDDTAGTHRERPDYGDAVLGVEGDVYAVRGHLWRIDYQAAWRLPVGALAISRSDVSEGPVRPVRRQQIRSGIVRVNARSAAEGHAVLVSGEGWSG